MRFNLFLKHELTDKEINLFNSCISGTTITYHLYNPQKQLHIEFTEFGDIYTLANAIRFSFQYKIKQHGLC